MRILKTTIVFLRTQQAVLLLLILALLAQLPHTATVFHRISTTQSTTTLAGFELGTVYGWALAYVAAISVELAVLMFVVRGRKWYSWGFAACSVLMNMFYYWNPTWSLWVFPYPIDLLAALLWSLILPVAIALYSHEIKHERDAEEEQTQTTITEEQVLPSFLPPVLQEVQTQGNGFMPFTNEALDTIAAALTPNATPAKQRNQPSKTKAPTPTAKSSRPQQVANLKQAGKSNAEIARLLSITESTVRVNWKQYKDSLKEQTNGSDSNNHASSNGISNGSALTFGTDQEQAGWTAHPGTGETYRATIDAEGETATADQLGAETGAYQMAA